MTTPLLGQYVVSRMDLLWSTCKFAVLSHSRDVLGGIKIYKLAPNGTDGRLLLTANFEVTWYKN